MTYDPFKDPPPAAPAPPAAPPAPWQDPSPPAAAAAPAPPAVQAQAQAQAQAATPSSPDGQLPPGFSPYIPGVIGYRGPGPEPKSQWWTDDDAYAGCMIYGLMALMVLSLLAGVLWWLVSAAVCA